MRKYLIAFIILLLGSTHADAQYYFNAPNASAYNPINNL
jgi:hypothetical protein